ncbi:MAG: hypothetical protein JNM63_03355 [Spirochaetia bacterium]|nr:hypothetical protein [Spirochaetia bacterium]
MPTLPIVGFSILIALVVINAVNSRLHVGIVAILSALVLGSFARFFQENDVFSLFPASLFITLISVTLLFSMAQENGTTDKISEALVRLWRGKIHFVPPFVFLSAALISALGAGNIASVSMLAPPAMSLAGRIGMNPFLMTILVVGGANSAALSPFTITGVVANKILGQLPQGMVLTSASTSFQIFLVVFAVQSLLFILSFLILGGLRWYGSVGRQAVRRTPVRRDPFSTKQKITLFLILLFGFVLILANLGFFKGRGFFQEVVALLGQTGIVSLLMVSVMMILRLADTDKAIARLPWSTFLLVCGTYLLISVIEKTGGMELATRGLKAVSNDQFVLFWISIFSGTLSAFSSSIGVVMPLFLPMVPSLGEIMHTQSHFSLVATILISAHIVDGSPLSSLGALCLAFAHLKGEGDRLRLFRRLLFWSLAMIPLTAFVCQALWN